MNTLSKILSISLIAMSLAGCGSSTTAASAVNTNVGVGSSSVASGLIGFTGVAGSADFGNYVVLGGQVPEGIYTGAHGQIAVGSSSVNTLSSGASNIQYTQQKPAGANGQFTFQASLASTQQLNYTGTIQLSSQVIQYISTYFGTNAQVTSMAIWVAQDLVPSSQSTYYNGTSTLPTYTGQLAQIVVWLYINNATSPIRLYF